MRQLKYFAGTVLVLAVLGVGAGFAWSALAPRTRYVLVDQEWLVADPNTQTLIAADGWFALVAGALGLVCGLAGYWFAGERAVAVVSGLAAGGVVGALVAYLVGSSMGGELVQAAAAGQFDSQDRLGLTAFGVLMFWPVLAAGTFWALEFAVTYRERREEPPPVE
ncbi:hypothetical protein Aph01nite_47190 [Acrocarpospora phusangensis]|uniref:DUF2567 domain-containing protein n=1 Tax=Acrocarpospora phusangensis TaxID=1070424 RepID=A0A919QEP9_9ACTN|nr:hypothetical protein [Acrocarpospora phusangensis]GIH26409.1 hypothetical protein Aph01nite_47190 [Acrocarpospora phusangensis]